MATFRYEIIETIAVLSEGSKGWKKRAELGQLEWTGSEVRYSGLV